MPKVLGLLLAIVYCMILIALIAESTQRCSGCGGVFDFVVVGFASGCP
jgi:hypothetical protein